MKEALTNLFNGSSEQEESQEQPKPQKTESTDDNEIVKEDRTTSSYVKFGDDIIFKNYLKRVESHVDKYKPYAPLYKGLEYLFLDSDQFRGQVKAFQVKDEDEDDTLFQAIGKEDIGFDEEVKIPNGYTLTGLFIHEWDPSEEEIFEILHPERSCSFGFVEQTKENFDEEPFGFIHNNKLYYVDYDGLEITLKSKEHPSDLERSVLYTVMEEDYSIREISDAMFDKSYWEDNDTSIKINGRPAEHIKLTNHLYCVQQNKQIDAPSYSKKHRLSDDNFPQNAETLNIYFGEDEEVGLVPTFEYDLSGEFKSKEEIIEKCCQSFLQDICQEGSEQKWIDYYAESDINDYVDSVELSVKSPQIASNLNDEQIEKINNLYQEQIGEKPFPISVEADDLTDFTKQKINSFTNKEKVLNDWNEFTNAISRNTDDFKLVHPHLYNVLTGEDGEYVDIFAIENSDQLMNSLIDLDSDLTDEYEDILSNAYSTVASAIQDHEDDVEIPSLVKFKVSSCHVRGFPNMAFSNGEDIFVKPPSHTIESKIEFMESIALGIYSFNGETANFYEVINFIHEKMTDAVMKNLKLDIDKESQDE